MSVSDRYMTEKAADTEIHACVCQMMFTNAQSCIRILLLLLKRLLVHYWNYRQARLVLCKQFYSKSC